MIFYDEIEKHLEQAANRWLEAGFMHGIDTKFLENTRHGERQCLPLPYRSYDVDKPLKAFEKLEDDLLLQKLLKHPFFGKNGYSAKDLVIGSSTIKISAHEIMVCLKRDVKAQGVSDAVGTLKTILEVNEFPLKIIAVIAGVSVKEIIQINDKLSIQPIDALPRGGLLKSLFDQLEDDGMNRRFSLSYSPLQGNRHKFISAQRCALVYDYGVVQAFSDDKDVTREQQRKQHEISYSLYDIANAIAAVHKCVPFIELRCEVTENEGLNNLFSTGGGSLEVPKLIPTDLPRSEPLEGDGVVNFIKNYLSIGDEKFRRKLTFALKYYVESQWVLDLQDKIIGHAIALECLLLVRNSQQKTKKLSQKASNILGSNSSEKLYYFKLFQTFYGLRSDIVHAGHLKDKKYKMTDGEELFSQQIYDKVNHLIPNIVQSLIDKAS